MTGRDVPTPVSTFSVRRPDDPGGGLDETGKGASPASRTLDPREDGWHPLAEPGAGRFTAEALLLTAPLLVAAFVVLADSKPFLKSAPAALAALLAFFAAMVPVHELVHALACPRGLWSEHLVVGAWPRRGLVYVLHDAPVSRRRVILMLAAPFAAFSVVLGGAALAAGLGWRSLFVEMLLVHTASCSGDCLTLVRIVRQVPPGALVPNSGWQTYWKCGESG